MNRFRKLANRKRLKRRRLLSLTEATVKWELEMDPFNIWEDINILSSRKQTFLAALKGI